MPGEKPNQTNNNEREKKKPPSEWLSFALRLWFCICVSECVLFSLLCMYISYTGHTHVCIWYRADFVWQRHSPFDVIVRFQLILSFTIFDHNHCQAATILNGSPSLLRLFTSERQKPNAFVFNHNLTTAVEVVLFVFVFLFALFLMRTYNLRSLRIKAAEHFY